jgi:hypothetical protein
MTFIPMQVLIAIALLGGVLQQGGRQLFSGFHMTMAIDAVTCVLAMLAVFIIEPWPPRQLLDLFGVRNQRAGKAGRNNEERRPTYMQKEKAHEDPNHSCRRLHGPLHLDCRPNLRP